MLHTKVWIPVDNELGDEIFREYTYMKNEQLCEAEFATYAKGTLVCRDPRHPSYEEAGQWMVEHMIEPVVKPNTSANSRWRPPRAYASADSWEYDFDVRPDC